MVVSLVTLSQQVAHGKAATIKDPSLFSLAPRSRLLYLINTYMAWCSYGPESSHGSRQ